jgi:uncharacterized protein YggE
MTPVEITVRGSHTVRMVPERATVYANLAVDGPQPQPVFDAVAGALVDVTASLESRLNAERGPVTGFAVDQFRRTSQRPYNAQGKQLPLVHTAVVSITATFIDFDDLAAWVSWSAGVPGLGVHHLDWALTEATRLEVERSTRTEAIRDAKRRAQDYADALDLGPVTVRSISDPGTGGSALPVRLMARAMADAGGPPQVELRPDEVEISAQVEATFVVGRSD